jgi:SEC-C motif
MEAAEFWDLYINSTENTLDIYDPAMVFFSEDLPDGFEDEYDVTEVVLEIQAHHKTKKLFEKVIAFSKLLKSKHPEIYSEIETYSNDFIINYYAYKNNIEEIKTNFEYIAQNVGEYYEDFLSIYRTLLFYQHIDVLDGVVDQNIENIRNSDLIDVENEYDLASFKFFNTLEKQYLESQKSGVFDKEKMAQELSKYSFDAISLKESIALFESVFVANLDSVSILNKLAKNKSEGLEIIQAEFIQAMLQKKFHFVVSAKIWGLMMRYWMPNNQGSQNYFAIETQKFNDFIKELSEDFFTNDKAQRYAVLWGSVYVYDFLFEKELITSKIYDEFIITSRELKGIFIADYFSKLWEFDFVHRWQKPDSISEIEFVEESKIFEKSLNFDKSDFSEFKPIITSELAAIGVLSEYIYKGEVIIIKEQKKINSRINSLLHIADDDFFVPPSNLKPIIRTIDEKISRNDPCHCGSGKKYKKCCLN